jgi:hypothetical protein
VIGVRNSNSTLLLSLSVVGMLLSGCGVTMQDGSVFEAGTSETKVRSRYGDPDLVSAGYLGGLGLGFGLRPATFHYYLDDKRTLIYRQGRGLWESREILPEEMDELRRRSRVYKEVVPLVPIGAPADEVIAGFGDPDLVERIKLVDGVRFVDWLLYSPGMAMPEGMVELLFVKHELLVELRDGVVRDARPMFEREPKQTLKAKAWLEARAKLAAEDPPRIGMSSSDVQKRWGGPDAVSGIVKGHEVVTQPGLDPAARLGTEVTSWYYLELKKLVRLHEGAVTAIEDLDPKRREAVQSFLDRVPEIHYRTGNRTPQERIK